MRKRLLILLPIFLVGLLLRFLYYPHNTYFGFDQARDAYAVREILDGHLKIVGPPTANGIFHHGVLYYYIFAPLYYFSGGNPAAVSFFLRVLNASGVFILYPLVFVMFGEVAAIIASFLFVVSYEQTQFALFLNHPSLAVISVLVFYLGLSYWIFRKKAWGFFTALFGLGLSIQFEFVEAQLIAVFILFLLFFRKSIIKFTGRNVLIASLAFLLPVSSYVISEVKNHFIILKQIPNLFFNHPGGSRLTGDLSHFLFFINRHFHDNLAANNTISITLGLMFLLLLIYLIYKKAYANQLTFLLIWFFGGLLVYLFTNNDAYFYNTGTSIALLVFAGFSLSQLFSKHKLLVIPVLILIMISNIYLITKNNRLGPSQKINPQIGLTLENEQKVVDFIYQRADKQNFAVNALTMPYNINTTWSYIFEWYGKGKYGYVPIWGGDAALGFPGNLKVETARSKLPAKRFLIIEPLEGIPSYLGDSFIKNEENFAVVSEKKQIGTLQVWVEEVKK